MDVRRLAAVDMHGAAGRPTRRRLILAEFVLGFAAMVGIGVWMLLLTNGVGWRVIGVWFVGVGLNYLPLALHALDLSRPGVLDKELAGADVRAELRRYTALQLWVFVPLALVLFAVVGRRRS